MTTTVPLDCRLCAHVTTHTGGCTSLVQCVDGRQFKATTPRQYWMQGPALSEGLGPLPEGLASHQRDPSVRTRFTVQDGGRWIDDDDFIFDATIKIGGDFSDEDRLRFAQWIADTLNAADAKLPRVGMPRA